MRPQYLIPSPDWVLPVVLSGLSPLICTVPPGTLQPGGILLTPRLEE